MSRESFLSSACELEAFRKYSAYLLTAIQDPEVLAWELHAENIIPIPVRDAATYMLHDRNTRTSKLLAAVESRIAVEPGTFAVFLSVLAKRLTLSDLHRRLKGEYGKPVAGWSSFGRGSCIEAYIHEHNYLTS